MKQRPNPPMIPFIDVAAQRRRLGRAMRPKARWPQ